MEPKQDQPGQAEPDPPVTDEWGLPVPEQPEWTCAADTELGYTAGEDPEDPWND